MSRFFGWMVYWTICFGVVAVFVHYTWPYGLAVIPLGAANIYGERELRRRHPELDR